MQITRARLVVAAMVAALAVAAGCTKRKKTEPTTAAHAGSSRSQAATTPVDAPLRGEVSITSRSPEAVAAFRRARDLLSNARTAEVSAHLKSALRLDPDFARAHAMLAQVSRGAKRKRHLARAAKLAPSLPPAERLLVALAVDQIRGDARAAEGKLKRLGELAPNDWRVQLQLGGWAYGRQRWGEVIAAMKKATALAPTAGEPYNLLGYALAHQGKHDQAIAALRRYAAMKRGEPNPQDSLGEILLMAGRFNEAAQAFEKAGRLGKHFWTAWEAAAIARFAQQDWEGGRAFLRRAQSAAKAPRDKLWLDIQRAKSFQAQGRTADALRTLNEMETAAKAQDLKARYLLAPFHRGLALMAAGRRREAEAQLDEAFLRAKQGLPKNNRRSLQIRGNLARLELLLPSKDVAAARLRVAAIEEAARKLPPGPFTDSRLHHARGLLALVQGDPVAAVTHLERCIPQYAKCRGHLVQAQRAAKNESAAAAARASLLKTGQRNMNYVLVRAELAKDLRARLRAR